MRSTQSAAVGRPCTEGFGNHNINTPALRSPARPVRFFNRDYILIDTLMIRKRGQNLSNMFWRKGYGWIRGRWRVLEQAALERNDNTLHNGY
jgi:hypothetical protein